MAIEIIKNLLVGLGAILLMFGSFAVIVIAIAKLADSEHKPLRLLGKTLLTLLIILIVASGLIVIGADVIETYGW